MVCGPGLGAEGRAPVERAVLKHPLVVTQLPANEATQRQPAASGGMLRAAYGEGGRLLRVEPDLSTRPLTAGFHSACDPEVSFDATRLLFAGKKTAADCWNIYEMGLDGSQPRQITKDLGDCRSPCYQSSHYQISDSDEPWYQITFVRVDAKVTNESGSGPAMSLYSCKLDGSLVRRLTYNLSSDFDPTLVWDGRLLYAAWQRATFEHGVAGRVVLLDANSDGSDVAPYVVQPGKRIKHMPCTTPGGLAVFVECDQAPWDGAGQLASVSLFRPLATHRSITTEADGLFHSPSPLPDGTVLVSRRPADGSGTHAVYRLDPASKRMALVYDDPQRHEIQARALAPRPEPDGRSSAVVDAQPTGKLYCLNVYTTDFKDRTWMPPGTAKRLRVVEGLPRQAAGAAGPAGQPDLPQLASRRILGEVPIAADGSFNLEAPANTPIELQLLDQNGLALRSCAWIWVRNHFNQGCLGCHEDGELSPENRVAEALNEPSRSVCPPLAKRRSVDFRRDVMPVVRGKCLDCHKQGASPPLLASASPVDAHQVYKVLRSPEDPAQTGVPYGKYVHPGRARTSPLVWHLLGRNTSRPWDGAWAGRAPKPIPPEEAAPLSDAERKVFIDWIDLGAGFEGAEGDSPIFAPRKLGQSPSMAQPEER